MGRGVNFQFPLWGRHTSDVFSSSGMTNYGAVLALYLRYNILILYLEKLGLEMQHSLLPN